MGRLDHPSSPSGPGCKPSKTSTLNGCVTPGRHDAATPSVTSPAEVFRTDLITAMKKPDGDILTDSEYALIEDSWKPEWERGVQVCVKPESSMKALKVRSGVSFECPKKFCPPTVYIEQAERSSATKVPGGDRVQYDMDNMDSQWLARLHSLDVKGGKDIDEDKLEACVSFLDLKCYENMCEAIKTDDGLGVEYDADVMCAVCRALDSEEGNEMVFCDRCNICVHQACYGIRHIPEGKWFCSPCTNNIKPICVLCGQGGGALKPVRLGTRWAHISCALWIPEVKIANVDTMEPISNFHAIPQSRWNLLCSICRLRQGACIQCCVSTCTVAFHVECAFQQSLKMKSRLDHTVSDAVRNEAYCPRHALLASSPAPNQANASTPQINQRERRLKGMMENFHQYARHTDLARKYRFAKPLACLLHSFWVLKRRLHSNQSFLPLPDPWQVVAEERLREFQDDKEKEEAEDQCRPMVAEWELEWERFMTLRQDMEKSRNLSYMILRRERLKKRLLLAQHNIFLKSADLALESNDSQNLALADFVVRSLHSLALNVATSTATGTSSVSSEVTTPAPMSPEPPASHATGAVSRSLRSSVATPGPVLASASPDHRHHRTTSDLPTPNHYMPAKRLRASSPEKASRASLAHVTASSSPTSLSRAVPSKISLTVSSSVMAAAASPVSESVKPLRTPSPSSPTQSVSSTLATSRRRSSRALSSLSSTPSSPSAAVLAPDDESVLDSPAGLTATKRRYSSRR